MLEVGHLSSMSIVEVSLSKFSEPIRDAVTTDVGEPFTCSHRVCCICSWGFWSRGSSRARLPDALLILHGYGCTDFLLGRGGGIWIAGAAAPELLLLSPDDSLITWTSYGIQQVRNMASTHSMDSICSPWLSGLHRLASNTTHGFYSMEYYFPSQMKGDFVQEKAMRPWRRISARGSWSARLSWCRCALRSQSVTLSDKAWLIGCFTHGGSRSLLKVKSTLYTAPGAAVEMHGFQEELVFVLGPFLPLLRYHVRLPRLGDSRFG